MSKYFTIFQMIFSVFKSQLLVGTNELKIVLNWKNTTLFCQNQSHLQDCPSVVFLRCGYKRHIYRILLYSSTSLMKVTQFYCFKKSQFKQGFASSAQPTTQWFVKFRASFVPTLIKIMYSGVAEKSLEYSFNLLVLA